MRFRVNVETALEQLACQATVQRRLDFPPAELRLQWEDRYFVLEGPAANTEALASFSGLELNQIRQFNEFIWRLPPEPDPMWHRDKLNAPPWPELRARAKELLDMLRATEPP